MNQQPHSFFTLITRAFFKGAFLLFGVGCAMLLFVAIVGALSNGEPRSFAEMQAEQLTDGSGRREALDPYSPVILQVDITGVIGTEQCTAEMIKEQLVQSREGLFEHDRVKAVLLFISSPGGSAFDSAAIHNAILAYRERYHVPVYAYADGLCASGGYFAACAADKIYAADYSLIGSIGVVSNFLNFSKAMETLGIESKTLTRGEGKDAMNPMRPWKADEDENMQEILTALYDDFVTAVVNGRPALTREIVKGEIGAHIFPSERAKELGMIDESRKSRTEAVAELATAVGLSEGAYQVYRLEYREWFSQIFRNKSPLFTGKMTHEFHLPGDYSGDSRTPWGYHYQPGTK